VNFPTPEKYCSHLKDSAASQWRPEYRWPSVHDGNARGADATQVLAGDVVVPRHRKAGHRGERFAAVHVDTDAVVGDGIQLLVTNAPKKMFWPVGHLRTASGDHRSLTVASGRPRLICDLHT
jgi:hypothetical protein